MTARQLYDGVLIELNKENAPNILLEDFNYFANKAINNYINKRYNIYDINQQTTDDLRVLKATAMLKPTKIQDYNGLSLADGANYEVVMPADYLHILNCICIYRVDKTYKCYNRGDTWRAAATRLTADMYSQVLDNFWNKPDYKRPYYYIHNVNTVRDEWNSSSSNQQLNPNILNNITVDSEGIYYKNKGIEGEEIRIGDINAYKKYLLNEVNKIGGSVNLPNTSRANINYATIPTSIYENSGEHQGRGIDSPGINNNPYMYDQNGEHFNPSFQSTLEKDGTGADIYQGNDYKNTIDLTLPSGNAQGSLREKGAYLRYGNRSEVRIEIRYGTDDSVFKLTDVYVDYIKAPQHIRLTQYQLDRTEDVSQLLEYPDYVCQEIINELVHLIMENISDQRLQTHPVVSQSIANPAQAQAPETAG